MPPLDAFHRENSGAPFSHHHLTQPSLLISPCHWGCESVLLSPLFGFSPRPVVVHDLTLSMPQGVFQELPSRLASPSTPQDHCLGHRLSSTVHCTGDTAAGKRMANEEKMTWERALIRPRRVTWLMKI